MLEREFFHVAAVGSKVVAGNHRDMIGVGAVVAVLAGKIDVVNAGDEFIKSRWPLPKIGFHSRCLHRKAALTSWGINPIGANMISAYFHVYENNQNLH
jgi:hypothetical protein